MTTNKIEDSGISLTKPKDITPENIKDYIISDDAISLATYLNEKPTGLDIDMSSFLKIFENTSFPELIVSEFLPFEFKQKLKPSSVNVDELMKLYTYDISFHTK